MTVQGGGKRRGFIVDLGWAGETGGIYGGHFYRSFTRIADPASMFAKLRQFLADESGATAIEYSLIASGIALAIIATVYGIGPKLNTHVFVDLIAVEVGRLVRTFGVFG